MAAINVTTKKGAAQPIEAWISQRFGKLIIDTSQPLPDKIAKTSERKIPFKCDCGKSRYITFANVVAGRTTSCTRCNAKSREEWLGVRWGKLRLDPGQNSPDEWGLTHRKMRFLCDCGKTVTREFTSVTRSKDQFCGHCSKFPTSIWLSKKYGKLRLDPNQRLPEYISDRSSTYLYFLCDCGNRVRRKWSAMSGSTNSACGMCLAKPPSHWLKKRFGKLRLDPDQDLPELIHRCAPQKYFFICDCGKRREMQFVVAVKSTSCGQCSSRPISWWVEQKFGKLRLDPSQPLPDALFFSARKKRRFLCDCGGVTEADLFKVTSGHTLSCGCLNIGQSEFSPQSELFRFVQALDPAATQNAKFTNDNREIDILTSKKIGVEYHGLVWHSEKYSMNPRKDYDKFKAAEREGVRLIQIYDDEWRTRRPVIESMLRHLLAPTKRKRIRPVFSTHENASKEVRAFLNRHHYLGEAGGCLVIEARYGGELVGAWVFQRRASSVALWHRACWDHAYCAWNPHEKALRLAIPWLKEHGFNTLITFSDNRFHTGNLYRKLGFVFEKEIPPNYFYTNGNRRVSKYSKRVVAGVPEKLKAAQAGWYRIWDSGKRRFSMVLSPFPPQR